MTFLSTGLLAGLLAAAIPVALHLLARQQPRRVVFPATRFLKASLDTQRDRLKVRRWWLLAMRIVAIACLAVALARPQIHTLTSEAWFIVGALAFLGIGLLVLATIAVTLSKPKSLQYALASIGLFVLIASLVYGGNTMARAPSASMTEATPGAVAIVIDNSIRSSRLAATNRFEEAAEEDNPPTTENKPLIESMRSAAKWMIGEQTTDSLIAIIDRSPRPATFSVDHAAAINRIERTEPIAQALPLSERVRAAIALVRSSDLEQKSVLVITDFTKPSFNPEQWESVELSELLVQEPAVTLQFLDLGSEVISNASLVQLEVSDTTPPRLAKTSLAVTVKSSATNSSRAVSRALNIQLEMYDTSAPGSAGLPVVRDSQVVLPPLRTVDRVTIDSTGGATKAILSVPPLEVGTHHGIVRLDIDDDFAADNRLYVTFVVKPSKPLLIIASDRDEANVIAGALTAPLAIGDPLAEFKIEITEFPPSEQTAWNQYAAVIVIDPASPTPPTRALIDEYLLSGGRLLSLLGPTLNAPEDGLPAYPDGLVRTWRIPNPGTFFEAVRPSHPALASLREVAGGVPWNAFRIFQYWQLAVSDTDTVIMRYAGTDHAAVIERMATSTDTASPNTGVHLIVTTPLPALANATRGWNRLFSGSDAWPAFLLVRDMVDSLVNRDQGQHNLRVGQSTRLSLRNGLAVPVDSESSVDRVQLFPPQGTPVPLVTANQIVTLSQIDAPGQYWVRAARESTGLSANLDENDIELSRIELTELTTWLGKDQYTVASTRDEIRQAAGKGQPTRSLYATMLILLMAAFVLEQVIANRFYATRTANRVQSAAKAAIAS